MQAINIWICKDIQSLTKNNDIQDTDTEGEQRKARVRNILKSSEKRQFLMNTLYQATSTLVYVFPLSSLSSHR